MINQEEISTPSTTGKMPWDDLFDCSYYKKTQVKVETIRYKLSEAIPIYPKHFPPH